MRLSQGRALLEVLDGLGFVDLDPVALLVDAAERIQGLGLALIGTPFKPGYREVLVRLDPVPMQQALRLQPVLVALVPSSLRTHVPQLRRLVVVAHSGGVVVRQVVAGRRAHMDVIFLSGWSREATVVHF